MSSAAPIGAGRTLIYRPEIDGLRAVAVIPVALFHARVPGFEGGFAGVDVFFLISGFLITSVLMQSAGDRGSLADFYHRRARRILPALLPVLAATLAGAWALFTPDDFRRYSQALAATALFASNMLFAMRSDYFSGEEGFEPLVHGWSLAVEEQFYLLYPILFLTVAGRYPRALLPLLLAILIASFVLAAGLVETAPRFAFNLLPTRAWELMAGSVLALLPQPTPKRPALGMAGIALIVLGFAVIDPRSPIPGPLFAIPVAGSGLVLRYAVAGTPAATLLSWKPLVAIGLVSYGLYLWHQALLAFLFYTHFSSPPGWTTAAALLAAGALATASYRWLERPIRSRRVFASKRSLATLCMGGLGFAAAIGIAGHFGALQSRSAPEAERLGALNVQRIAGWTVPNQGRLPFLLYGDSHAGQYYDALTERYGPGALLAASGCLSLPSATNLPGDRAAQAVCRRQYGAALAVAKRLKVPVVIWAQRWERDLVANATGSELGTTSGKAAAFFAKQLAFVRSALPAETRLIIVGNSPTAWASGGQMDKGMVRCRAYRDVHCPISYPARLAEGRAANRILRSFAARTPGVTYVDAAASLCPGGRCRILERGRLYYYDGSHLTAEGARLVVDRIAAGAAFEGGTPARLALPRRAP